MGKDAGQGRRECLESNPTSLLPLPEKSMREMGWAAMLSTKRSAGVAPEMKPRCLKEGISGPVQRTNALHKLKKKTIILLKSFERNEISVS